MKYLKPGPGEWVRPVMRGYKLGCCDCGLVHTVDFEVIKWGRGSKVRFRVWRDNRATALMRRHRRKDAS